MVRQDGSGVLHADHVLLTLAQVPSRAQDVLVEAGLTAERLAEAIAARDLASIDERGFGTVDVPSAPPLPEGGTVSMGPTVHELMGWVRGFAAAEPDGQPTYEYWLLALLYLDASTLGPLLDHAGQSADELVAALRRRGVRVPDTDPPAYRAWRGRHHIDVSTTERTPLLALLDERHSPASVQRWAFTTRPDDPDRSRVYAEDGIDLRGLLAVVRERAARN